jgi:hypothetical protein
MGAHLHCTGQSNSSHRRCAGAGSREWEDDGLLSPRWRHLAGSWWRFRMEDRSAAAVCGERSSSSGRLSAMLQKL